MSDYGSFAPILKEAHELLGRALYPTHDGDSPEGTPNTLLSFCKAASEEIKKLRADLEQSVAREAAKDAAIRTIVYENDCNGDDMCWMCKEPFKDDTSICHNSNCSMPVLRTALANPDPSAKSLLRDRERLAVFMQGEIYLHQDTEYAYRLFWRRPEGLDVALSDCKKTKNEAIDAAMTAKPATPDVVADGDGNPK